MIFRSVVPGWLRLLALLPSVVMVSSACSPALNWREVRAGSGDSRILFPCKPTLEDRKQLLAGMALPMRMYACQAEGAIYALAWADTAERANVSPVLEAWTNAQVKNLNAETHLLDPFPVHVGRQTKPAGHQFLKGRLPDGSAVQQEAVFFASGTRVVRAMVMAPHVNREAASIFFESLNWSE